MSRFARNVEELKYQWEQDPCWDIETTEGFEDHKEELLTHRLKMEAKWDKEKAAFEKAFEAQRIKTFVKVITSEGDLGIEAQANQITSQKDVEYVNHTVTYALGQVIMTLVYKARSPL